MSNTIFITKRCTRFAAQSQAAAANILRTRYNTAKVTTQTGELIRYKFNAVPVCQTVFIDWFFNVEQKCIAHSALVGFPLLCCVSAALRRTV